MKWLIKKFWDIALPQYEYRHEHFSHLDHVQWKTEKGWEVVYICKSINCSYEVEALLRRRNDWQPLAK